MLISHSPLLPSRVGVAAEVDAAAGTFALRLYWDAPGDPAAIDGGEVAAALAGRKILVSARQSHAIADLVTMPECADHGVIALAEARWSRRPDRQRPLSQPYQLLAETLAPRRAAGAHLKRTGENVIAALLVPWRRAAPAAMALHINHHPDFPLIIDAETTPQSVAATFAQVMPTMTAPESAWVAARGEIEIGLSIASPSPIPDGAEIWLDATGGHLPLRRVPITPVAGGGFAVARFLALGLRPGESVKLKAGWRFWPAAAETIVRVP
jgi:hypothetical protein